MDYLKDKSKPSTSSKPSFLAKTEGAVAARSDLADAATRGPDCSLREPRRRAGNSNRSRDSETDSEDVRAKLARVVPGLHDLTFAQQPNLTTTLEYYVGVVQVTTSTSGSSPSQSSSPTTPSSTPSSNVVTVSTPSSSVTPTASSTSSESSSASTSIPATTIQV